MFERGVCHLDHYFIRSQAVCFYDDRAAFVLGCVQCWSQLIECDLLIPEINRGSCTTSDADDLLIDLRTERKPRERDRNRNPGLQNKIRTEQQKENQEKNDVEQREKDEPAEVIFLRPAELHARAAVIVDLAIETCFSIGGGWFRRLLEADDPAERSTLCQHVHNLNPSAFHFVQHRVDAR